MNEIAVSVSRQPTFQQQFWGASPASRARHPLILNCLLAGLALLLAATTGGDADLFPAPALAASTPTRVVCVPVASPKNLAESPALPMPQAGARFQPAAQVGNRFETEYQGGGRPPLILVSAPTHRAFSGPMWKFLLDGPVRPDIDLTRNPNYYGIMVTLPFGG